MKQEQTFGRRVRTAMLVAGIMSAAELAERCGVSRPTASRWLGLSRATLEGEHLVKLSEVLKVRTRWLAFGRGVVPVESGIDTPHIDRVVSILDRMNKAQCERWFRMGEQIVGVR